MYPYPKAQNSPKALYGMVFGPKSHKISVLRALGLGLTSSSRHAGKLDSGQKPAIGKETSPGCSKSSCRVSHLDQLGFRV